MSIRLLISVVFIGLVYPVLSKDVFMISSGCRLMFLAYT